MKKLFVLTLFLVGCFDDSVKTHIVKCNFPRETFTDTIVARFGVAMVRDTYSIGEAYYPVAFCTVRTTKNEQR